MPTTVTKPIILDETGQDLVTQLTRIADAKEATVLSFGGSVLFANLPSPTANNLNYFYRIIDAFTTTSDFVVGAGVSIPAGSYFAVIDVGTSGSHVYKYDELGNIVDMDSKQDKTLATPITVDGTQQTKVEGTLSAINTLAAANKTNIGTLASLTTTDKSDLVHAVNEVNSGKVAVAQGSTNANKVLKTNSSGNVTASDNKLQDLDDTNISSPANDQVLKYDSSSSKWINGAAPANGHIMKPDPATSIPETGNNSIVSFVNGATGLNENVPSLYTIQKWSNEKTVRKVMTGSTPIGSASIGRTGIGTWDDSPSPTTTDWWQDNAFIIPDNADDITLSLKFDPSSGEPITLGGYILDTTNGKLCIKFGNSISTPANAKVAVDITYTRNCYA